MSKKMLIDASHAEETRVVVVENNHVEEFDFESEHKKQLKGNIYLARITRVEPSLQAAFVEYGGGRHGFLAFSEIHPDYYQIPLADRKALKKAQEREERVLFEKEEEEVQHENDGSSNIKSKELLDGNGHFIDASTKEEVLEQTPPVDILGEDDILEDAFHSPPPYLRKYRIQEVIKRRQIILVQVVKEERGNKGAALTTYLSLAGRYSVLMPNTARGARISRKITNLSDRKKLKKIVQDLNVPDGMGVILRTAGAHRNKNEIKRDYEYLIRLWEKIRSITLESIAPTIVHEEGNLIKRCIRDLYDKTIFEILVSGDAAYREAKDFMRMLMPSQSKVVQPYKEPIPLFTKYSIESQLEEIFSPRVTLKSGGYLIINQTEALVAVDVNSGRSTKENSVESMALQTNLEATEELARQLRLRDLAGLIVIDFIDMSDKTHVKTVERRLKECLKNDRARIQLGHISHFGLMEMSRQRLRSSVLESTTQSCPTCDGIGHIRSQSSSALQLIRDLESYASNNLNKDIVLEASTNTALYVLNNKRHLIADIEARFNIRISIEVNDSLSDSHLVSFKNRKLQLVSPQEVSTSETVTAQKEMVPSQTELAKNKVSEKSEKKRKSQKNKESLSSSTFDSSSASLGNQQPKRNGFSNRKRRGRKLYFPHAEPVGPFAELALSEIKMERAQHRRNRLRPPLPELVGDISLEYNLKPNTNRRNFRNSKIKKASLKIGFLSKETDSTNDNAVDSHSTMQIIHSKDTSEKKNQAPVSKNKSKRKRYVHRKLSNQPLSEPSDSETIIASNSISQKIEPTKNRRSIKKEPFLMELEAPNILKQIETIEEMNKNTPVLLSTSENSEIKKEKRFGWWQKRS